MVSMGSPGNGRRSRCRPYRPRLESLEPRTLPSFITTPSYAAGTNPLSVAVGDFNGDGVPDLATANYGTYPAYQGTVSILLGKGDGTFGSPQSYAVGSGAAAVAVADLNGDGVPDLAVTNSRSNSVSVLLGNGDGTFQAAQAYAAGTNPHAVAVGDFNGDGLLDLVVTNLDANGAANGTVSVLLGTGAGTFQDAQGYAVGSNPQALAVGDFNGDGHLDLAVTNTLLLGNSVLPAVSILLGAGDGSFQAAQSYAVGASPTSVALGDFNGDGILDLAVANNPSPFPGGARGSLSILLGRGDGTFQAAPDYAAGIYPVSVAAGDFNGDARADLAVANSDGTVSILLGKGDGTFQVSATYAAGSSPQAVVAGDFNSDGHVDLVVANSGLFGAPSVSILLGHGDGTFLAAPSYEVGGAGPSVVVGDFNNDGYPDLAVGGGLVLLGRGDGTFRPAQDLPPLGASFTEAVGDFNGDGILDLAIVPTNLLGAGSVTILLGNGDGTFRSGTSYPVGLQPRSVAVGDFNGDGIPDLVIANYDTVSILLGKGDGTFQAAPTISLGMAGSVAVEDLNGDGISDLAVIQGSNGNPANPRRVSILLGNGDGTFHAAQSYPGSDVWAVGDLNGDGIPDLAVFDGGLSILLGQGDGTFRAAASYAVSAGSLVAGDFNADGIPDLVFTSGGDQVTLLLGNGDGTFQTAQTYAAGSVPSTLAAADFTGDGYLDLAVGNQGWISSRGGFAGSVSLLVNGADWGGGHAARPPHKPHPHPSVLPLGFVHASVERPLALTFTARQLPTELSRLLVTVTDQSTHAEMTFRTRPLFAVRHAQDVLFEDWENSWRQPAV